LIDSLISTRIPGSFPIPLVLQSSTDDQIKLVVGVEPFLLTQAGLDDPPASHG
jgi:hypothetical protein